MRTTKSLRSLFPVCAIVTALLGTSGAAVADPVAFVVNETSHTVSIVDVQNRLVRDTISTLGFERAYSGQTPTDVLVDAESGRVFVSTRERIFSFDGYLGNSLYHLISSDKGSGVALDAAGRRVFMSHEEISGSPNGLVSEYSIADPSRFSLVREHVVSGVADLRFIAFDARYQRVYAVDDDGSIVRTGFGDMNFARVAGASAPNPGGILADPNGGVWITSRTPAKLVRLFESGTRNEWAMPDTLHPRGLAFDREVAGAVLVAVDDRARVRRFQPTTGAFSDVMTTEPKPRDVAVTLDGTIVSSNRIGSNVRGTVTASGVTIANTDVKSGALALFDVPRLAPSPTAHAFCYRNPGDRDEMTFRVRNTRVNRQRVDLSPIQVAGANPGNYAVISNACSAARLSWGDSCQFNVRFTAAGASVEPPAMPPPFGTVVGPSGATWPAEIRVTSTDGTATAQIPIRAARLRNVDQGRCSGPPPLIPLPR